jgi:primosomal protein N'
MPPGFDLGELLATPGGTLIAAAMLIQGFVLLLMAYAQIKRPSGSSDNNALDLASKFTMNQHNVIIGLLEGLGHINTTLKAYQTTLETLAKSESGREARWDLSHALSNQQSDSIEELKGQQERLGAFLVTSVNKGEGREELYLAQASSVNQTSQSILSLIAEIRDILDRQVNEV